MKRIILLFKVFFICFCLNSTAKADTYDSIQVYLLTCEPHDEVYSLYGHTAIRVVNPATNMDIAINYGAFDSTTKNFVLRFIFGLTDYMMMIYDYKDFLAEYRYFGSAVHQQHINMSTEEKRVFMAALAESAKPENIVYRYNYFYNNCTTKARDIILGAVAGEKTVERTLSPADELTFRELIHEKTASHPWAAWGNDFLLGVLADVKTTIYEAEFIPDRLMTDFDYTVVSDFDGKKHKLVDENVVVLKSGKPYQGGMTDFPLSPLTSLLILAVVILLWSIFRLMGKGQRLSFNYVDYGVCCLYAVPGILLTCMIFSQHPTVSVNFQILIFNPFLFWLAHPKCKVRRRWEIILCCVVLFLLLGIFQSYAEGVIFLGLALGILAAVNIKRNRENPPVRSLLFLAPLFALFLSSCGSTSRVSDDLYAVKGNVQKQEKEQREVSASSKTSKGMGDIILKQAKSLLGTRYRSGGASPSGFDCSGFTSYVYSLNNINIGRSSRDQYARNIPIKRSEMRSGDLVFFSGSKIGSDVGHVGIVMEVQKSGDAFTFIHSSNRGGVKISRSTDEYYARRYMGVRRVVR